MSARLFRISVVSALFLLGLARVSSAEPVVIYTNFGPPPGYVTLAGESSDVRTVTGPPLRSDI